MPFKNLKCSALEYVNQWCEVDSWFVEGIGTKAKSREARLKTLCEAAADYKVSRTLKILAGEEERLSAALEALDSIPAPTDDAKSVDSAVSDLATKLHAKYGSNAISAASKFLWFRFRSPVVIYDSLAYKALRDCGETCGSGDYGTYRAAWRREYERRAKDIRTACDALVGVQEFSRAALMSAEEFAGMIRSPWFHERVFDFYLLSE